MDIYLEKESLDKFQNTLFCLFLKNLWNYTIGFTQ